MGWLRTFFKGEGVHVHVRRGREAGGSKVTLSGTLARSVRPRFVSYFESLPLENATLYITGDASGGWRIERSSGIDPATEQRIRNFLANEA